MLEKFPQSCKAMRLHKSQIRNHTVFVVTLYITTRQTAMNAFSSFYRTTGSCVLDMTQWWNEQSKANPPNSHRAASWCIQIQAAHQGSREQDTLCISLSWKSDAMSIGLLLPTIPAMHNAILRFLRIRYTCSSSTGPSQVHEPPTCNSNNAPTAKVTGPSQTPAFNNRLCPIQCVFIFLHVKRHIQCLLLVFDDLIDFPNSFNWCPKKSTRNLTIHVQVSFEYFRYTGLRHIWWGSPENNEADIIIFSLSDIHFQIFVHKYHKHKLFLYDEIHYCLYSPRGMNVFYEPIPHIQKDAPISLF